MKRERLRIVLAMLNYYCDHPSGSTRLAFDEAAYWVSLGHELWIVTQDTDHNRPRHAIERGMHVLRYQAPQLPPLDPRRIRVHQESTKHILRQYFSGKPDLVRGHSLLQYSGAVEEYGSSAKRSYSVHSPVKLEMRASSRGETPLRRLQLRMNAQLAHRIEHSALLHSERLFADSRYTKTLIAGLHGRHAEQKTRVIPGWVDLNTYRIADDRESLKRRLGWTVDVPILFTLRRLVPRMGLDRLLLAVRQVIRSGQKFHLFIGGTGPLRAALQAQVEELDLRNVVHFTGFVPTETLPMMYAASDAFVLPTAELECFGLIALEALACGRPVLATPVGAIPEVLSPLEPAWLAENASAAAIAELLQRFLGGQLPVHEPGELRRAVAESYSSEHLLPQLIQNVL